ncbi:hypothetical protein CEXT_501941 [Caerostris extrusa]|uniref:Uncharacterized protein n=1 Tax=Caerostris extrusa TaxID=172846 RepID=A0AAV4YFN5_CAEEX|nr:hypothetical protein CEXT_501941 [Caerostris extrusa]
MAAKTTLALCFFVSEPKGIKPKTGDCITFCTPWRQADSLILLIQSPLWRFRELGRSVESKPTIGYQTNPSEIGILCITKKNEVVKIIEGKSHPHSLNNPGAMRSKGEIANQRFPPNLPAESKMRCPLLITNQHVKPNTPNVLIENRQLPSQVGIIGSLHRKND